MVPLIPSAASHSDPRIPPRPSGLQGCATWVDHQRVTEAVYKRRDEHGRLGDGVFARVASWRRGSSRRTNRAVE